VYVRANRAWRTAFHQADTTVDRPVVSVTTAPSGLEGEGFPVRRAFAGVDLAALDPFIHMDQMGEVDYSEKRERSDSLQPKWPGRY